MIAHDQIEKNNPRADLIRFRSIGETLAKKTFDVIFITLNDKGKLEEGQYKGLKVYKIPLLSRVRMIQLIGFCILLLPVVFRARGGGKFDIVFFNSVLSVPGAAIFRWLSGYGILQFDLMGIVSEERFLKKSKAFWAKIAKRVISFIEDFLLKRIDFITTINEKHKQIILKRITKPIYVVRDGIFEAVLERPPVSTKETGNHSKIEIIFIGQINHFRLDLLFRIMPMLLLEFPNLQMKVLGSGPQLNHYMNMAGSMGFKKNIIFGGHVSHEEIFDHIGKADIAYTDDWSINGFPMKIFEYMAMGKPIVAEATEGIKELLEDNVNALLYENEEQLKEKILILARDEGVRREIGRRAKGMIFQHTWEKRAESLMRIYQKHVKKEEGE